MLFCWSTDGHSASSIKGLALLEEIEQSFVSLVEALQPSVVAISPLVAGKVPDDDSLEKNPNVPDDNFHKDKKYYGSGSGIILSADGYIITNNHVVGSQKYLEVKLFDTRKFIAEVVGSDPDTDLAVLKIDLKGELLKAAPFGDSEAVRVGQWVVAVGQPYGLEKTVTFGTVTGIGREQVNLSRYENYIQTDASINPGNSGGPLFNIRGEIIGINTAILNYAQGIGFAIPSNMAKSIYNQLISNGFVVRGWLGIGIQSITADLAEKFNVDEDGGVLVNEVFDDNPAAKAGIIPGDIITSINKKNVTTTDSLSRMIAEINPDQKVEVEVIRNDRKKILTAILTTREMSKLTRVAIKEPEVAAISGAELKSITPEIKDEHDLTSSSGVLIISIAKGSIAESAGLRSGDIIIEAEREAVSTLKELKGKITALPDAAGILLRLQREDRAFYLVVPYHQ